MNKILYLNHSFVEKEKACIPIDDRGFLLGDGLFETMRAYQGKVILFKSHYHRLVNSLGRVGLTPSLSLNCFQSMIQELLYLNKLDHQEAAIRVTVTRGSGPRGLTPPALPDCLWLATASPFSPSASRPVSAMVSTIRKNEFSPSASLKSLCYLDHVLAKQEAIRSGFEEAVLLNTRLLIAEATAANIFLVKNNTVYTPPVSDGILPGITRENVIDLCGHMNIPLAEQSLPENQLFEAEEIFLTNALSGIYAVHTIQDFSPGKGKPGQVTQHLQERYLSFIMDRSP